MGQGKAGRGTDACQPSLQPHLCISALLQPPPKTLPLRFVLPSSSHISTHASTPAPPPCAGTAPAIGAVLRGCCGVDLHLHVLPCPHLAATLVPWVPWKEWELPGTLLAVPVPPTLQLWVVQPSCPCPVCICCPSQADGFSGFLFSFGPSPPWNTFKGFLKLEKPLGASSLKDAWGRA